MTINVSDADRAALQYGRFHYPEPRVPVRMDALYLRSHGVTNRDIPRLWGISKAGFHRYLSTTHHERLCTLAGLARQAPVCLPESSPQGWEEITMAGGRKSSWHIGRSPEEHQTRERWARATTIAAGLARQGKIILLLADGSSQSATAQAVGVPRSVVRHWAKRCLAQRLDGLTDAPGRRAKGGFAPSDGNPPRAPGLPTPGAAGA